MKIIEFKKENPDQDIEAMIQDIKTKKCILVTWDQSESSYHWHVSGGINSNEAVFLLQWCMTQIIKDITGE